MVLNKNKEYFYQTLNTQQTHNDFKQNAFKTGHIYMCPAYCGHHEGGNAGGNLTPIFDSATRGNIQIRNWTNTVHTILLKLIKSINKGARVH